MANLKAIRKRITSVQSTKKITRAMNMVAAAKLRKMEQRLLSMRPYADTLIALVEKLNYHMETIHPFYTQREGGVPFYVFISGDKGLCGSFNSNIIRLGRDLIKENPHAYVAVMGKKVKDAFRRMDISVEAAYSDIFDPPTYHAAQEIADFLSGFYLEHEDVSKIIVVYNRFKNSIVSEITQETFLPRIREIEEPRRIFLAEPDVTSMLEAAMKEYLESEIYRIMMESLASEHGARMTAMEAATDNAEEMINDLVLKANRERQSMITTEISEIVGGANALQ
ncbi:MAG TPA: ATP synthase F1 subunit gamma [Firmicutes bacterium]|nr:ATP synthase F1 subunit gamma [Bacillota bacterium]